MFERFPLTSSTRLVVVGSVPARLRAAHGPALSCVLALLCKHAERQVVLRVRLFILLVDGKLTLVSWSRYNVTLVMGCSSNNANTCGCLNKAVVGVAVKIEGDAVSWLVFPRLLTLRIREDADDSVILLDVANG